MCREGFYRVSRQEWNTLGDKSAASMTKFPRLATMLLRKPTLECVKGRERTARVTPKSLRGGRTHTTGGVGAQQTHTTNVTHSKPMDQPRRTGNMHPSKHFVRECPQQHRPQESTGGNSLDVHKPIDGETKSVNPTAEYYSAMKRK